MGWWLSGKWCVGAGCRQTGRKGECSRGGTSRLAPSFHSSRILPDCRCISLSILLHVLLLLIFVLTLFLVLLISVSPFIPFSLRPSSSSRSSIPFSLIPSSFSLSFPSLYVLMHSQLISLSFIFLSPSRLTFTLLPSYTLSSPSLF